MMATDFPFTRRRLIVPEVVQTSGMDCGPAALKCLLDGFRIRASYGRLREACQTDVDGTSIDTLEEIAAQLGLQAEQIMVPADHVLLSAARALPAIVVARLPNGLLHFVVAWRCHGNFVQVMDPATGRRWPVARHFLDQLYLHTMAVPAADWRAWAGTEEFLVPLRQRLARLGLSGQGAEQRIVAALADAGWESLAALDAATRMVASVVRAAGLRPGQHAAQVLETVLVRARDEATEAAPALPALYWSVRPAPPDEGGGEQLLLRGAVLVRVGGPRTGDGPAEAEANELATPSLDLAAVRAEPSPRPWSAIWRLLRADGLVAPATVVTAMLVAGAGLVLEGLLLRGLLDLGQTLATAEQRLAALIAVLAFATAMLCLELPIAAGFLRSQRQIEARLRMTFLRKIPRLGDRYFHSRPISDMAERSHSIHRVRPFLDGIRQITLASCELLLTAGALVWLYPASTPLVLTMTVLLTGLVLLAQPLLGERHLRVLTHAGALGRFYLDALLGLVPARAHGAERALRREHESLLVEWGRARLGLQYLVVAFQGLLPGMGFAGAIWLLFDHLARGGTVGSALLLLYWALKLPQLAERLVLLSQKSPELRNLMLRLLEPLAAPEETDTEEVGAALPPCARQGGVSVVMEDSVVRAAGHTILEQINLAIAAGEHVAIVGPSGAGKSSLVGLLLGWHRLAAGQLWVDGEPLDGPRLAGLRHRTAWVDPAIQLWNRSLADNLRYGAPDADATALSCVIEQANLRQVLEQLPDGPQTPLGEDGGLVSGGEGQRVRLGRALMRPDARLVILDEPFRGLSRDQRHELLVRARHHWQDATLLCITHDISETQRFERVLVIEEGRIVEDGAPGELLAQPGSRYRTMLEAETEVRNELWSEATWHRLQLVAGQLLNSDHIERHLGSGTITRFGSP